MSLISALHKHPLHNKAHYQPYLARYHAPDLTLLDHYMHLKQVLPIYQALEKKLRSKNFSPALPAHLSFALSRSAEIEKDIAFLKPHIPADKQDIQLESTKVYVDQLDAIKMQDKKVQTLLFSHFLIRILGDLFGGQGLKNCAVDLYKREKIYLPEMPTQGTRFYSFPKDALKDFSAWLNALKMDKKEENEITDIATDAYQKHIDIFIELEKKRSTTDKLHKPVIKTGAAQNSSSFFNCRNFAKAAVVAVVAGVAITTTINRLGS